MIIKRVKDKKSKNIASKYGWHLEPGVIAIQFLTLSNFVEVK